MAWASACGVAGQQVVQVGFDPVEEGRIGDRPVLDDLGQPGAQLARRQRAQRVQVANHALRLVEGADHVLAAGWLMAVLPPTEESTCASSVVGTCTNGTPRM